MKYKPSKPNKLLLNTVQFFKKVHFAKYGLNSIDKSGMKDVKPPFILLYNHIGSQDHFITGSTLLPYYANNMMSGWVRYSKMASKLSQAAGCFFKNRFYPDATSIIYCKNVLRRYKNVLAMAPSGTYSIDGTTHYIDYSTAKLIKLFKVPVVAAKLNGVYFYSNGNRTRKIKSNMRVDTSLLLTPQEISELSEVEIYKRIWNAIDFNDFDYIDNNFEVIDDNKAEGMEYVLYHCPKCGTEYELRTNGNVLYCEHCGNAVELTNDMRFVPSATSKTKECVYLPRLDKWNKYQRQLLRQEVLSPDFCLTAQVTLKHNAPDKKYGMYVYGNGTLTINKDGMRYVGSDNGQQVDVLYSLSRTSSVGYQINSHITVERDGNATFYIFDDARRISKMVQAFQVMRLAYYPDFEGEELWFYTLPNKQGEEHPIKAGY